jgi:hypothetical protein
VLRQSGLYELLDKVRNPPPQANILQQPVRGAVPHMWGGQFHMLPQDFQFPSGGILTAFQAWCTADVAKGYPPLRQITPTDMPTNNMKKRLSDYRYLMNTMEQHLKVNGGWIEQPTLQVT